TSPPAPELSAAAAQAPRWQPCAKCAGTAFGLMQIVCALAGLPGGTWQTSTLSPLFPPRTSVTCTNTESVAVQSVSSVMVTKYQPLRLSHTVRLAVVSPLLHRNWGAAAPSTTG